MTYEHWSPKPFRVQLEDDAGTRWWVKVPAAIGIHDAIGQVKYAYPGYTPLRATPFTCESCGDPMDVHDSLSGTCRCGCVTEQAALYPGETVIATVEP